MSSNIYGLAHELGDKGEAYVVAQVVRAEKPTSAKPGDKALITADGVMHGWIGGSCAQPTVIMEAMKALQDGESRFIRLSPNPREQYPREGLQDVPITCFSGGTLEIFIEPQLPTPRLLVVGSLPVAQTLVKLGKVMGFRVIGVDPETRGAGLPEADEIITDFTQISGKITPLTYIVVASHGKYDEAALVYALRSKAAYVALVSSRARAAAVLEYLAGEGLSSEEMARLKYPAGLNINALKGDEIALSIMAEIIQKRRSGLSLEVSALKVAPPAEATDLVCGMKVKIEGAQYTYDFNGQRYYFCCPACRKLFKNNPAQYLTQAAPSGEATDPVCGMVVDIATAQHMTEFEGRLVYFCAEGCKTSFDQDPVSFLAVKDGAH